MTDLAFQEFSSKLISHEIMKFPYNGLAAAVCLQSQWGNYAQEFTHSVEVS